MFLSESWMHGWAGHPAKPERPPERHALDVEIPSLFRTVSSLWLDIHVEVLKSPRRSPLPAAVRVLAMRARQMPGNEI